MKTQEKKFTGLKLPGIPMLIFNVVLIAAFVAFIVWLANATLSDALFAGLLIGWFLLLTFYCISFGGFMQIEPNEARVLIFFGKYHGTVKENGFFWVNPFYAKKKLTLRARNLDAEPIKVNDKNGNPFVITERGGVLCDKALISTSRKPDISSLGFLANEIELDDGVIAVNEYMETSFPGIYAAGDITGLDFQTQAACRMGETAAANAMGGKVQFDIRAIPMTLYTTPEAASVGMTEDEARTRLGDELLVGESQFSSNIRAILNDKTDGFVKVLAGKKYGEIYGVHIVGMMATEMISEPAALMRMEVTIHEVVGDILHAHPTYSEAFAEACQNALDKI